MKSAKHAKHANSCNRFQSAAAPDGGNQTFACFAVHFLCRINSVDHPDAQWFANAIALLLDHAELDPCRPGCLEAYTASLFDGPVDVVNRDSLKLYVKLSATADAIHAF